VGQERVRDRPEGVRPRQFVVCLLNHERTGSRMLGERLSQLVSFEMLKLAVGTVLISPFVPVLFMGEEYGEDQPFLYFVSHTDPELVKAVQEGRKNEFKSFEWGDEVPDPQSEDTFNQSKLKWDYAEDVSKNTFFHFYKQLIQWRKQGLFKAFRNQNLESQEQEKLLLLVAGEGANQMMAVLNFNHSEQKLNVPGNGGWKKIVASSDEKWGGFADAAESLKGGEELQVPSASLLLYQSA